MITIKYNGETKHIASMADLEDYLYIYHELDFRERDGLQSLIYRKWALLDYYGETSLCLYDMPTDTIYIYDIIMVID